MAGRPLTLVDPKGLEGVGPWTFPAGKVREAYVATIKSPPAGSLQFGLGGSLGYFVAGATGEAGVAIDSDGTRCTYAKFCGASPFAGGLMAGGALHASASCGIGALQQGRARSLQLQLGAMAGAGMKGTVELNSSGVSAGASIAAGGQVSGGAQVCETKYWCSEL